jgi:fructose-specific phosphotransferase system IIA component
MNIYPLLQNETILPNLVSKNKKELLNTLIDVLADQVSKDQLEGIRQSVLEREGIMSTGVGKGLAIPHGKTAVIEQNYASFAILKEPVDYESIDNQPVKMVFLLAGPVAKNSSHIKLLSRISRLMNSNAFRESLEACTTSEEILKVFKEEEERYFGSQP